eukprot:9196989-Prorocentrum_lima.AAC.1
MQGRCKLGVSFPASERRIGVSRSYAPGVGPPSSEFLRNETAPVAGETTVVEKRDSSRQHQ